MVPFFGGMSHITLTMFELSYLLDKSVEWRADIADRLVLFPCIFIENTDVRNQARTTRA